MAFSVLSEDRFQNEDAAFAFVESAFWPDGPTCPHCGNADPKRIRKMAGQDHPSRPLQLPRMPQAVYRAAGTIFEFRIFRCIFGFK